MLGYLGMVLLLLAYAMLLTKWSKFFVPIDIVASVILTIHAIMIKDAPFMVVNGLVSVMLIIKFLRHETV